MVLEASAKYVNANYLNQSLFPGRKLQNNIDVIFFRFRLHPFVFTTDIRQMYRQILIAPEHRRFQLIRWRFSPDTAIQSYQLNTVTYGISSSPYLAIRCLLQLPEEGKKEYPLVCDAINEAL